MCPVRNVSHLNIMRSEFKLSNIRITKYCSSISYSVTHVLTIATIKCIPLVTTLKLKALGPGLVSCVRDHFSTFKHWGLHRSDSTTLTFIIIWGSAQRVSSWDSGVSPCMNPLPCVWNGFLAPSLGYIISDFNTPSQHSASNGHWKVSAPQ